MQQAKANQMTSLHNLQKGHISPTRQGQSQLEKPEPTANVDLHWLLDMINSMIHCLPVKHPKQSNFDRKMQKHTHLNTSLACPQDDGLTTKGVSTVQDVKVSGTVQQLTTIRWNSLGFF